MTGEEEPGAGALVGGARRAGRAGLHRPRVRPDGSTATDDDALCSIEGRVRVEPQMILVRRLEGGGPADLDAAPRPTPAPHLPPADKRPLELSLGHAPPPPPTPPPPPPPPPP